jgi:hypothetical protein
MKIHEKSLSVRQFLSICMPRIYCLHSVSVIIKKAYCGWDLKMDLKILAPKRTLPTFTFPHSMHDMKSYEIRVPVTFAI